MSSDPVTGGDARDDYVPDESVLRMREELERITELERQGGNR